MAGDSVSIDRGSTVITRHDGKVYCVENSDSKFVMGGAGSTHACTVVRYCFIPPRRDSGVSTERYMMVEFPEAIRRCLKERAALKGKEDDDSGYPEFLVGYLGKIWQVSDDMATRLCADGYWAIGSGGDVAKGALAAMRRAHIDLGPITMLSEALNIASQHIASVRPPFTHARTP
jgi:hypothetical protein